MTATSDVEYRIAGFPIERFEQYLVQMLQDTWSLNFSISNKVEENLAVLVYITLDGNSFPWVEEVPFGSISAERLRELSEEYCDNVMDIADPGQTGITFSSLILVDSAGYFGYGDDEAFDVALENGDVSLSELLSLGQITTQLNNAANSAAPVSFDFELYDGAASRFPGYNSDFDGDGFDEVLFFNPTNSTVGQYEMPLGIWDVIGTAGANWEVAGTGWFDYDFNTDILWFNTVTRNVGRFDMEGGRSLGWQGMGKAGVGWEVIGTGEFDGDQLHDILWFNATTRKLGAFEVNLDAGPTWHGLGAVGAGWEVFATGNVTVGGDDVLFYNESTGGMGVLDVSFQRVGTGYKPIDAADFSNDNDEEVLVYNEDTRALGYYDLTFNGNLTSSWVNLGTHGAGWTFQGAADVDGSGTDDIIWRHDDGRVGAWLMDGANRDWEELGFASSAWEIML